MKLAKSLPRLLRLTAGLAAAMAVQTLWAAIESVYPNQALQPLETDPAAYEFGLGVAVDADAALVGDPGDESAGAVYAFARDDEGVWRQILVIEPSDGDPVDAFGRSIALDGDTAMITGSVGDGSGGRVDVVYLFERDDGGAWRETAILDAHGSAALDGDTAVIGTTVLERDAGGDWVEVAELDSAGGCALSGPVDVDGDSAIIAGSECASVFVRDGTGEWTEQAVLVAADGAPGDQFGDAVAIWGDTVVVGAGEHSTYATDAGAAYVYTRDGSGAWTESEKLIGWGVGIYGHFGRMVALRDDVLLVGAYCSPYGGDECEDSLAAVHVFEADEGGAWVQRRRLLPAEAVKSSTPLSLAFDGRNVLFGVPGDFYLDQRGVAYAYDLGRAITRTPPAEYEVSRLTASDAVSGQRFGRAAAVDGDTAVVGATGSSYVFVRVAGGEWAEHAKLVASDGGESRRIFGEVLDLDADTVVVGTYLDDTMGRDAGAAYVFERDAGGYWRETAKLLAADGAPGDQFGRSVAVEGGTVLIGAPLDGAGSVYIFRHDEAAGWTARGKLVASDGQQSEWFGGLMAVDGGILLVAGYGAGGDGRVLVFEVGDDDRWSETTQLPDLACFRFEPSFGRPLAVSAGTAIVGCDVGFPPYTYGGTRIFVRDAGGAWTRVSSPSFSDPEPPGTRFGDWVALDADTAIIGAPDAYGEDTAYVFAGDESGEWRAGARLLASDGAALDGFGRGMAFDGLTAVIGAPGDDDAGEDAGSAYIFDLAEPETLLAPLADANGNGSPDFAVTAMKNRRYAVHLRDGADGSPIRRIGLGRSELRFLAPLGDASGNGYDELLALSTTDEGEVILRAYDSGDGSRLSRMTFKTGLEPLALLPLNDPDGGLGARAVAVAQVEPDGGVRVAIKDALTGSRLGVRRFSPDGTPVGAAAIRDVDGNGVEEIVVFGYDEAADAVEAEIQDATGAATDRVSFAVRGRPAFVGRLPSVNDDASEELFVASVDDSGAVKAEIRDSFSHERLAKIWWGRKDRPVAIVFFEHSEGPAVALLGETADGTRRARVRRLPDGESINAVPLPAGLTAGDFAALAQGGRGAALVLARRPVYGESMVKVEARDAADDAVLFRFTVR